MTWREAFDRREELANRLGALSGPERDEAADHLDLVRAILAGCEEGWWRCIHTLGIEPERSDPDRLVRLCSDMTVPERVVRLLNQVDHVYRMREASR